VVVLTPESKGWCSATCPALPGCHSQGNGIKQTMANIREAIELVLDCWQRQTKP
jgi:antitoxin HicB